jgi:diguanylate cyclase (GGDEF)-like protein/PAS domain S-box-containing protein
VSFVRTIEAMAGSESHEAGSGVVERVDLTRVFQELLVQHPDALVAAIGNDGLFVPMPATVPIDRHRVVVGRSVIDMVVPADKVTVITTWERCRQEGGAHAIVHLIVAPERPVTMTLVDACADHGAYLVLFVPTNDTHRVGLGPSAASLTIVPRTARVRKTELAIFSEIDAATSLILGWSAEDMIGRRSLEFIHPDDQERAISNWMEMLTAPGHDQRVRLRQLKADGSWVWMELNNRNLLDVEGQRCVLTEMLDISEELAAQEALRASEQLLRRLAETLPIGVIQIEADRRISYANERAGSISGARTATDVDSQFRHVVAADEQRLRGALDAVLLGEDCDIRARFDLGALAGRRLCTVSMRALTDEQGGVTGAIVCVADVTDQELMTAELERRATFDSLTGCYNRQSVMSTLDERIAAPGAGLGIIFVDLDGFKQVNDTLGHATGDALLVGVGARLREAVRPGDIVGRVGGDEFLVVCTEIDDVDAVRQIADRIDGALARGVHAADGQIEVRASLGVAHTTTAAASSDRLVAEADAAMYVAKREARETAPAVVTAAHDRPSALRTRATDDELELQWAIEHGDLEVHFQPVVALSSRSVRGLEALVRWRRDGEMVPAVSFIELAERTGLIVEMGAFIVNEVCRQAAAHGFDDSLRWFVNMSPTELAAPGALASVLASLDRHDLGAERIVVEVTEHSDLSESVSARRAVEGLAAAGASIALDDFGTGYSSLALLRSLPIEWIKVDRSFTMDLGVDPVARHLIDICADLARKLDLGLIVEGVETEAQAAILADAGVELVQGYLFSPARPIEDLRARLFDAPGAFRVR